MRLLRQFTSRVLDKSPVSGPGRGPPSCNKWRLWWDSSSLRLTSWPLRVLRGRLACQWTRPSGCNWDPFVPGLLLTWTTGQSVPTGKEQETLLTSLPFPLSVLSLDLPILPVFLVPLVLDAGIWSKGLSLSWGLETDHLLLAENSNFLVWFLVGPSSSPPFSGSPGKSPVTPGCLQVAGDVCKATPFAPLSRLLLLSTWLPFLLLKSLKTSEVLCLYRRFSERLYSCI